MSSFARFSLRPLSVAVQLSFFGMLCVSAGAYANEDEAPNTLPKITLKATKTAKNEVKGYKASRSSAGTKTDTPLNEVPQSISVVTKDQIKDQGAQSIAESLRYSAGVTAEPYGVDNRGEYFSLRGGSSGEVVLDGLRQPLVGWWGSIKDEPYSLERVEVIRGPSAVTYGQNPPGGLVNLVSKQPQAVAKREVSLQYGSFEHKQATFDFTGPIDDEGKVLYRVIGLKKDSGTQVNYAKNERDFLSAAVTYLPADGTKLTVYGQYQKDDSGNTNAFLPWEGTLKPAKGGLPKVSDKLFVGEPDWDNYGAERKRFGYALEQKLSDNWTLRHNFRADNVDGSYKYAYLEWYRESTTKTSLYRMFDIGEPTSNTVGTDLQLEGKLNLGSFQHTLFFGTDYSYARSTNPTNGMTAQDANGNEIPLDLYNPVYGNVIEPTLENGLYPVDYTPTVAIQRGFSFQDQIKYNDRFVFVAGVRHDTAISKRKNSDKAQNDDAAWSKRLGFVYLGDYGLSPYVSYSESFVAQADLDANDFPLKPKRGEQYELGLKWMPTDQNFSVTAAIFNLKEKNRAKSNAPAKGSTALGEVTVKGAEIEAKGTLDQTSFIAGYTYTDAKDTSNSNKGDQLETIPKHTASAWVKQQFSVAGIEGFNAGAGVRYLGKNWGLLDNKANVSVPAVTLFDAMLSYDYQDWGISLNAKNLTDKEYIATCLGRGDCWFGSRRSVIGTLTYRW